MKNPAPVAILAARLQRACPALSPYSAAALAEDLAKIERAQRRHAERCCSGEDGGYVRIRAATAGESARSYSGGVGYLREHDPVAEERAGRRIEERTTTWHRKLVRLSSRSGVLYRDGEDDTPRTLANLSDAVIVLRHDPRGAVVKAQFYGESEATSV